MRWYSRRGRWSEGAPQAGVDKIGPQVSVSTLEAKATNVDVSSIQRRVIVSFIG